MAFRRLGVVVSRARSKSFYERWMEQEGVPIVEGFSVRDLRELALRPWKRLGCDGAYLQLSGLEGVAGVYVGKLAPGQSSEPEKHLFEKIIYIVEGEGVAEIQQQGRVPQAFHWRAGSLFSPPMNATHRLINHSPEPALFLAVTTAPLALDHYHNARFVFNNDFCFSDRYDGERDYFAPREEHYLSSGNRRWIYETNFIADLRGAAAVAVEPRWTGENVTQLEMANNALTGRLAGWPVGKCYTPGDHGGGAVLVNLGSEGYSLIWPKEFGPKPYETGHRHRVVRVDWQAGSVFSAPANCFQRHFNTGREPGLQLALYCGGEKFPMGAEVAALRAAVYTSVMENPMPGEFADEDAEIRRMYELELRHKGIAPDVNYAVAVNAD